MSEEEWPEVAYFASQFRKAREEMKLTQRELATRISMDQGYIGKVETKKINPTLKMLVVLAQAIDKPLSYLILDRASSEKAKTQGE